MRKLDKSKPVREMMGDDPDHPYRFIQNGVYFDDAGNEVTQDRIDKVRRENAAQVGKEPAVDVEAIKAKAKEEARQEMSAEIQARVDEAVVAALAKVNTPQTAPATDTIADIKGDTEKPSDAPAGKKGGK